MPICSEAGRTVHTATWAGNSPPPKEIFTFTVRVATIDSEVISKPVGAALNSTSGGRGQATSCRRPYAVA